MTASTFQKNILPFLGQALILGLCLLAILVLSGCSSTLKNQNPIGQTFPSVTGTGLDDKSWKIPEELAGEAVILLIGYKMDSQFDIDRWLIGLDQKGIQAPVFELPTIPNFFAGLFAESIDEGMRRGIPAEIWSAVVTIYKDGAVVEKFTGNENPRNARALVLDKDSKVVFFHDRGFSVGALNKLQKSLSQLKSQ